MTYPKTARTTRFGTNPPGSKAPDRPDFHRGEVFARRFARKRRETACGVRQLGRPEGRRAERGLGASGKLGADLNPPGAPPPKTGTPPLPHRRFPPQTLLPPPHR